MSAFLCSTLHTVACAILMLRADTESPTIESARAYAAALRKVNNRALKCRYGDKPEYVPRDISAEHAAAIEWLDSHSANDAAAIAHCLQYQCSEGDTDKMKEWALLCELIQTADKRGDYSRASVWSI